MATPFFLLAIIVLFVFLIYLFLVDCNSLESKVEGWTNYQQLPLGNHYTGFDPLQFYDVPRYRKPYRYPVCHIVDYPVKHCAHLG